METMYGAGTDPMPYIMAAYGIGMLALVGFFAWTLWSSRRLRAYLAVIQTNKSEGLGNG